MFDYFLARFKFWQVVLNACLIALLAVAWSVSAQAQDDSADSGAPKPEKLFESDQLLTITLRAPWNDIVKKKKVQDPYPATIEFTDSLGQAQSLPLSAARRGITRQEVCKFPPIRLIFDKELVKGTMFRGQKRLKMVTHCDKGDKFAQFYRQEMTIYRMYNLITDISFRVRPLTVTYVDSVKGETMEPQFAFLIEDDGDMAERNGLIKLQAAKIRPTQLEPTEISRMMLFQFMIANVDFAATAGPTPDECCHNAKLVGLDETSNIYSVPYDFDVAGIIKTPYAVPHESLPIKSVTQRLYRGFCMYNSTMETARQEFLAKEQALYDLVQNESLLADKTKGQMREFLADFFEILRDQGKYEKSIIQKCRK
ncbi:MAG TPA: hypothetical protein VI566_10120 [Xanthomonadales bacterium]|nr:hypothetical protein [Xanthomonadales bacterium]